MSQALNLIRGMVRAGDLELSYHCLKSLTERYIDLEETISGLDSAILVEERWETDRIKRVVVLQRETDGSPVHVVWETPEVLGRPAVLVTAYRPDPAEWTEDFKRRR